MRPRRVFLVAIILATVVFWYMVDYRIKRAHTTAVTPNEFRLFAVIMVAWVLYFSGALIKAIELKEKSEADISRLE